VNRSELRLVVGAVLAVAVPAAVLHSATPDERLAVGLTAAPFAWPRVLVAHLATALPLGLIVAGWVRSLPGMKDTPRGLWMAVGFGWAGVVAALSPGIGDAIAGSGFGPVPLLLLRATLAITLVLPWCIAATAPPSGARLIRWPGIAFGVGLGLAVIPCGMYTDAVTGARTEQAAELLARERLVRAEAVVGGLCELGSERQVANQSPADVRKGLGQVIPRLRRAADRPLPASAPRGARLERALLMIQLDRLDEAAGLLRPLSPADTTAALLLATVHRDQERWAESDALYSAALEKRLPRAENDANARADCLIALEGLVFNARADRRPADAERVLNRGLEALPSEAAYLHFQLGRHYADGGRPGPAVEHLRAAAAIDPNGYQSAADDQIRRIRTHTPACLLTRSP